jgi:curved DNA-binding protein CbpA
MPQRRRLDSRFPYRETVWLRSDGVGEFVSMQACNISVGGLFVLGEQRLELQSEVELKLDGSDGGLVALRARVTRIVTLQTAQAHDEEAGVGLEFVEPGVEQLAAIAAIVELARSTDTRPRVPRVVPEARTKRPLSDPMLDYVLSRVDGTRSPEALAQAIGLERDLVVEMIHELRQLGVVELTVPPAVRASQSPAPTSESLRALDRLSSRGSSGAREALPSDLDVTSRAAIDALYTRTADSDYYTSLGVARNASREDILRAFVALAHSLGPEAYAGRQLGAYQDKLERILQRLGDAYAALGNERLRQEYDSYLARVEAIRALDPSATQDAASLARSGDEHEAMARYEERHQEWEKAALSWVRVYETRPDDASCARHAARALLETKRELRRAQTFAERATILEPANPLNHRLLARILVESGLRLRARKELQLAADLEKARARPASDPSLN